MLRNTVNQAELLNPNTRNEPTLIKSKLLNKEKSENIATKNFTVN